MGACQSRNRQQVVRHNLGLRGFVSPLDICPDGSPLGQRIDLDMQTEDIHHWHILKLLASLVIWQKCNSTSMTMMPSGQHPRAPLIPGFWLGVAIERQAVGEKNEVGFSSGSFLPSKPFSFLRPSFLSFSGLAVATASFSY